MTFRMLLIRSFIFFNLLFFATYLHGQEQEKEDISNKTLLKSIFFGGGSYYIDEAQIKELNEFIYAIENINRYEILVHSFTDNIGSKSYNQWLSMQRSEAVLQELEKLAIPIDIILKADFGEVNPIYSNATYIGKLKNRRVDVILRPLSF
jgi:OOP family OmpA-OmpF porin